ncbi:hypothetical protein LWI29_019875 [Acer saccharum]|uniref:DUF4283 domain-containing protein n=1 Tax=Acer saccharum TaxID=4024 RepID=A0AA39TD19_ACESA|nr:hypothetical protein LWI29_019875 [Acer saccharum]
MDGHEIGEVEKENIKSMFWDYSLNDQVWLKKCAIGILKGFKDVSRVNHRLESLGCMFSSLYLGDKSILWVFDSEVSKERFIREKHLWEDYFSMMGRWFDNLVPQSRLAWVNVWGTPISCWSPEFFMKLGWQIGEPLLVDNLTLNKVQLDRGRILVLVPQQTQEIIRIKIHGGQMPCMVKLEVDANPIDMGWLENFLALRKNHLKVGRNSRPKMEDFQIGDLNGVGEDPSAQVGKDRRALEKRCQESSSEMAVRGKVIGQDKLDRRT